MQDVNVSNDLRQLSLGRVKTLEYSRYDINEYHFWTAKLEASRPFTATTNNKLVRSGEDATSHVTDYYDILQNIVEYMFGGAKELKVVFSQCDWLDPVNGTRVDEFGMVEVMHESCYSGSNLLLAHQAQQVSYLSYPPWSFKNWWVVCKVRPKMHKDDEIYQEEIEVYQNFTVSDRASLVELDTGDVELLDEKVGHSKKHLWKSKRLLETQERREQLDAHITEADSDADDFWYVNYLLLL
jgi:hypothetical protein